MKGDFDTSKCMIDIARLKPGQKMIAGFPELSSFPEFMYALEEHIKIAILYTDKKSPFLKIKDPNIKLTSIYEFLEIGLVAQKRKEEFKQILEFKHEAVIDCCFRYIQMQHDTDYNSWWTKYQLYYEVMREVVKVKEVNTDLQKYLDQKVKWQREADKIATELKALEDIVFNNGQLARAVATQQIKKIITFPEKFAVIDTIE